MLDELHVRFTLSQGWWFFGSMWGRIEGLFSEQSNAFFGSFWKGWIIFIGMILFTGMYTTPAGWFLG